MTVRAYAGPPVVQVALAHPTYGSWNELPDQTRDRAGIYPGSNVVTSSMLQGGAMDAHARLLSNEELWAVYRQCPEVRASVEAIVRVISTWDWTIEPVEALPNDDPLYEVALDAAEEARRFLAAPNEDGEVWQTFASKALRDLLVYDSWATENVLGREGSLDELVTLPGGTVHPRVDRHQRVVDYKQVTGDAETFLDRDQVVYFNLFPNTQKPGGTPLIETLINEVITLLRASKHLMLAYDADEVPPGVLLLAGIAGKAAERAVAGLRNMRGADHKLRVLTTNNPRGLDARWVEFRHTPKDLDMAGLVKEIRRTVWRLFGVKPITMGDSEATPRATAEVQVEAQDSGLIRPIIELLQAQVNMRILPLVVGDPELAALVQFKFNTDRDSTAEESKAEAEADGSDFDRGGLTVNELRAKRGRLPVEGGDVVLLRSGAGYTTLDSVLGGGEESNTKTIWDSEGGSGCECDDPECSDPSNHDGDEGGVSVDDADAAAPEEGEEAPGEVEASRPRLGTVLPAPVRSRRLALRPTHRSGCACGLHHEEPRRAIQLRSADSLLPSEWQPEGKFKGYRTMKLDRLGRVLVSYQRAVEPLYRRARIDTVAAFRAYANDGELSGQEGAELSRRVASILDRLVSGWDGATAEHYRDAARIGRDAAADYTGVAVVGDWRERADLYQGRAMSYLTDTRGLVADVRAQLQTLIAASVRGTETHDLVTRADGFDVVALLGAVGKVFQRNRHRIANWTGRLVELANETFGLGMAEGGTGGVADEELPPEERGEWWVEWASVGDNRMCLTCEREGEAGFRPLSQVPVRPGGATECRARCRCVLVFWTRDEVQSGKATRLSNTAG